MNININDICFKCKKININNYYYCLNCHKIICFDCFFDNLCCDKINYCIFYNNIIIDKIDKNKYNILKNNKDNLLKEYEHKLININKIINNVKNDLNNYFNIILHDDVNYDEDEIISFIDLYYDIIKTKYNYYTNYLKSKQKSFYIETDQLKKYYELNKINIEQELKNLIIHQYKVIDKFDTKILKLNIYKKFIEDNKKSNYNFKFKQLIYYYLFKKDIEYFPFNYFVSNIAKRIYHYQYVTRNLYFYKCFILLFDINNNLKNNYLLKLILKYNDGFNQNKIINEYLSYLSYL